MKVIAYDPYADPKFLVEHNIAQMKTVENLIRQSDIVSLHLNLTAPRKLSGKQRKLLADFAESMGAKLSQSTLERVRDWLGA